MQEHKQSRGPFMCCMMGSIMKPRTMLARCSPHPLCHSSFISLSHLSFISFLPPFLLRPSLRNNDHNQLIWLSSLEQPFSRPLFLGAPLFPLSQPITRISSSAKGCRGFSFLIVAFLQTETHREINYVMKGMRPFHVTTWHTNVIQRRHANLFHYSGWAAQM